jgi:hypothetical protein
MAVTAAASPAASNAPAQGNPQFEDKSSASVHGDVPEVRAGSIPAAIVAPGIRRELGSGLNAEAMRVDTENDDGGGLGPSPRYSDLLDGFLPFDRSSLKHGIDRFLRGLETFGTELTDLSEPASVVPALVGTGLAALAAGVTLRQQLARDEAKRSSAEEVEAELARFVGFPNPWRLEES